jgi:ubiquinone/menaquinone biosynthesis C-methylase UbiE
MLTLLLDDKLFLAPIGPTPQVGLWKHILEAADCLKNVIDVGTGTGIWAMYVSHVVIDFVVDSYRRDFADKFPSAQVTGTDISDIQPSFVPPNCKFELDDAQLEWTFASNHFDFVHVRCLFGSIKDWPYLYEEIFRCTKPGGYIEQLEMSIEFKSDDDSLKTPGHIMPEWSKVFIDCGEEQGRTFKIADLMKDYIKEAASPSLSLQNCP